MLAARAFALIVAGAAASAIAQTAAAPPPAETADPTAQAASAPAALGRPWSLRLPTIDKVVFRGSVNHDAAGMGTGAMMYPAPNAIGLLAAVLTHGLISSSARESQKSQMQSEADKVLQPFESVLSAFTNRRLMEEGLRRMSTAGSKRVIAPADASAGDWLIESAPVFSMTQDRGALVLDNVVRIYAPGSSKVNYAQTVRVVSRPLSAPPSPTAPTEAETSSDLAPLWLESEGRRLVDSSVALFAESLDIALDQASLPTVEEKSPYRTFRYAEGGSERMERAQLVSESCGRTLIRTLRGWLMSIPAASSLPLGCTPKV